MARLGRSQPFAPTIPKRLGAATIALTGTIIGATEANIVTGGRTIILTVSGDSWVAAGGTFDAQRQNIINGMDSAQAEATGWDAVVKATAAVTDVVRTSAQVVTVTLEAFATYDITATETITVTVPSTALIGAAALVAVPTFTVTAASAATSLSAMSMQMNTYGPTFFRAGSSMGVSV